MADEDLGAQAFADDDEDRIGALGVAAWTMGAPQSNFLRALRLESEHVDPIIRDLIMREIDG